MKKTLVGFAVTLIAAALFPACNDGGFTPPGDFGGAHITGVVRVQGHGVGGARVRATTGVQVRTDANGRYCLSAPTFTRVALVAEYATDSQVRAGDWFGMATVHTSDFVGCENAQVQDFDLAFNPI